MDAPNPFTERGVIRDPKRFFGRKHELKQIFERLAAMQSVSIVGERRIGKSSLLAVIAATGPDRLGQEYEFHYIDLERVESTDDFIARVLDALSAEGETIRDLERAIEGRKVVLCLDEFEQSGEFSKEFFGALRSLASTGDLALVVASRHRLADLARNGTTTSPFFNIFTTLSLGPLSEAECGELLNGLAQPAGKTFPPDEMRAAYLETAGNPWKLQIFGYYLYETGRLAEAMRHYREEMAFNGVEGAALKRLFAARPASPRPAEARLPAALLIAAAVIGLVSIVVNFGPGMILMLVLTLISFLLEALRTLSRRGAS